MGSGPLLLVSHLFISSLCSLISFTGALPTYLPTHLLNTVLYLDLSNNITLSVSHSPFRGKLVHCPSQEKRCNPLKNVSVSLCQICHFDSLI